MSWSHSSKLGLAVVCLVLVAAVGVASGVSVTDEAVPQEAEAGQQATVFVELQDLYTESGNWTFDGQTALENATWTVEQRRDGESVASGAYQGSSLPDGEIQLKANASEAPDTLAVEITGTVPAVDSVSYDDPATFQAAELARVTGSGASIIDEYQVQQYTTGDPGSQTARTALDDANATIQSANAGGADVSAAQSTFEDAVFAYDSGDFGEAVSLAGDATAQVNGSGSNDESPNGSDADGTNDADSPDGNASTQESSGGSDDGGLLGMLLYGVLGLLLLGAVGGGVYWYTQRDQGPGRDPLG